MNCFTRVLSRLRLEFHWGRVSYYRQQGKKLLCDSGELASPQMLTLSSRIDHHGCIIRQLEQELEAA